ncbi:MAG: ATP-grasp domain-containing protein [Lachnospiraceae bacterium]|nr:ATP-grasp domain-containing protein [Lachnospiraceae bacterium]
MILVDYLDNPPAKAAADLHIQESTMDMETVCRIAEKYRAQTVISACVDQANLTACYVDEKLGLPYPYSYELASKITNKGFMKQKMFEYGIPTSRYIYLEKDQELTDVDLKYPVMVKPADSCASSGVKKAVDKKEMLKYLAEARKISRNGRTIVEEFADGFEVSVYAFVSEKKTHIIMISQRMSVIEGEEQVLKCYATLAPAVMSETALSKIEASVEKIAEAFGLNNTPLHVQILINGDDISVIEFAPRVGGGISFQTILDNTEFDILEAAIDSYLQVPVVPHYVAPKYLYTVNLIYGYPGVFDHLEGAEALVEEGIIESIHFHKTKGMQVTDDRASGGRIGAFLVKAEDKDTLLYKIALAMERMQAFDVNGSPMMRKDLYLKEF